ncbi:MAG: 16S rRNA (cytidine(1402)-2'-O)-methyltransferase [Ignavibacteriota bacterium]
MRENTFESGILQIVSTSIGNPADISARAIEAISSCDILICEELKPAKRLLFGLGLQKELILLNEHTTREATAEVLGHLESGNRLALVSDAGTPLLADPGSELVRQCIERGIAVVPIPGASSVLAALVCSGFSLSSFTFAGFLPRDRSERKRSASQFKNREETLIFLEAPYRLNQLLGDLKDGIGAGRNAVVCIDLTMPTERFVRGTLGELEAHFTEHKFKGEFVVIVEGIGARKLPHRLRTK